MYIGSDYYPEHWIYPYDGTLEEPESRWEGDAQLMAHAGLNVVRMGEFSWGLCEREEGKFDFAWLRRAMDCMGRNNIKVVLGTRRLLRPSGCPRNTRGFFQSTKTATCAMRAPGAPTA